MQRTLAAIRCTIPDHRPVVCLSCPTILNPAGPAYAIIAGNLPTGTLSSLGHGPRIGPGWVAISPLCAGCIDALHARTAAVGTPSPSIVLPDPSQHRERHP
jgi:hypothetical protein